MSHPAAIAMAGGIEEFIAASDPPASTINGMPLMVF
jgi:hypothetical protein